MNTKINFKRPHYFYSLLTKIVFFITLTVLVLSLFLNYNFTNYSIRMLNTSNEKLMNQIFQNALQTDQYVRTITTAMFSNPDTANLMYGVDLTSVEIVKSIRQLDLTFSSVPFIQSALIYNGRTDTYYTFGPETIIRRQSFYDTELAEMLKDSAVPILTAIPRLVPVLELDQDRIERVFTYVLPEYFPATKQTKNALVVNVRMDWLFNTLSSYRDTDSLQGNNILIMDDAGQVVAHSDANRDLFLRNLASQPFVRKILTASAKSGVFLADYEGQSSVITYVSYPESPWILVNITPYKYISGQIDKMKRITLSIEISMFMICLITAFLLARNLYAPVRSLRKMVGQLSESQQQSDDRNEFAYISESFQAAQHKLSSLESFRKTNMFTLKQKHLKDLLFSKNAMAAYDEAFCQNHVMAIDPRASIAILLFTLDNYDAFRKKYSLKDQSLLKYALLNITNEVLQPYYRCESLDAGEACVAAILNLPDMESAEDASKAAESLKPLVRSIQAAYAEYCSIGVSAFISHVASDIREIQSLFEETLELSHYRIKYGYACLLSQYEMDRIPFADHNIDNALIAKLLDALRKARLEEASRLYMELVQSLANCRYNTIMFTLSYFSSSIFNTIDQMERNGTISFALDFVSFDNRIKSLETFDLINEQFLTLMRHIVSKIEKNRDEKSELVASAIVQYIDEHYKDKSLSASHVADVFKLTTAYANLLLRTHASRSIAEYITEVRLVKAAELLRQTSLNLEVILERIGWENKKHFFTLFKKRYSATPTDYRLNDAVKSSVPEIGEGP